MAQFTLHTLHTHAVRMHIHPLSHAHDEMSERTKSSVQIHLSNLMRTIESPSWRTVVNVPSLTECANIQIPGRACEAAEKLTLVCRRAPSIVGVVGEGCSDGHGVTERPLFFLLGEGHGLRIKAKDHGPYTPSLHPTHYSLRPR